jgi:hypothetical protein
MNALRDMGCSARRPRVAEWPPEEMSSCGTRRTPLHFKSVALCCVVGEGVLDLSDQIVADIMQFLDRPMRDERRRDRQEPIVALG